MQCDRTAVDRRRDGALTTIRHRHRDGGGFLKRLSRFNLQIILMEAGQCIHHGREHRHRWSIDWKSLKMMAEVFVQARVVGQALTKSLVFIGLGQSSEYQQICRLDEIAFLGELLDGNAAIAQNSRFSIDKGD